MNKNKGIIGIGLILAIILGIAVVSGGAYYLGKKSINKVGKNQLQKTKNLNTDLYPLYPNLSWGNEVPSSLNTPGLDLSGFKIVSKNILDGEYYKLDISFEKYYDTKLTSLGWIRDDQFQADGGGSSSWLYKKGDEKIIFYYNSTAINQKPNEPLSCPCNMVFEIFSGKENIDKTIDIKADLAIFESKTFGYLIGYSGINSKYAHIENDGKGIRLFPNQSNIDTLEIVDSSYVMPSYTQPAGEITFGTNQYKKFKDSITPRHTYYLKSGLENNKSILISIENDSDNPNYFDLSSLKINIINSSSTIVSTASCTSDKGNVMTYARALEIAKASSCNSIGKFTKEYNCNKNNGGLVDVYMEPTNKPGCGFACRVSIDTGKAEDGWMCTGGSKLPVFPNNFPEGCGFNGELC